MSDARVKPRTAVWEAQTLCLPPFVIMILSGSKREIRNYRWHRIYLKSDHSHSYFWSTCDAEGSVFLVPDISDRMGRKQLGLFLQLLRDWIRNTEGNFHFASKANRSFYISCLWFEPQITACQVTHTVTPCTWQLGIVQVATSGP